MFASDTNSRLAHRSMSESVTPARGIAGDAAQRNQHLTFWEIEAADVAKLRAASIACQFSNRYSGQVTPAAIQELIDSVLDTLFTWRNEARVRWCRVIENRPEIVTRRDEGTRQWIGSAANA